MKEEALQHKTKTRASRGQREAATVRTIKHFVGAAFQHPALWITLAMLANVLEGAIRKWVPGFDVGAGRAAMYFSKDLLLVGGAMLVAGMVGGQRPGRANETLQSGVGIAIGLILLGSLVSVIQGFNAVGAALTLRALVFLPLAAFVVVQAFGGRFPLQGFAAVTAGLVIGNGILSLIQNSLPSSHILNQYAVEEMHVVELASGVRATGTFAYITGLSIASALGVWAGMVMISLAHSRWQFLWGAIGILSGIACAFASISRGTVVTAFAMLGLWALSSVQATRMLARGSVVAGIAALIALLLMPTLAERFMLTGEGVFDRFGSAGDSNLYRAVGQWEQMWEAVTHSPLGGGLGTEQVGGNFAAKGVMGFTTYEAQFPRIVVETGVLGFLGFLVLVGAVVWALQETKKGPGGQRWDLVATATQLFILGQCYSNLVFNHTASAAVWLVAAAVFAAEPRLRRGVKRRRQRRFTTENGTEAVYDQETKAEAAELVHAEEQSRTVPS